MILFSILVVNIVPELWNFWSGTDFYNGPSVQQIGCLVSQNLLWQRFKQDIKMTVINVYLDRRWIYWNKRTFHICQSLIFYLYVNTKIWDKVFKNAPSTICGRQPLKNFTWSILVYFIPYRHFVISAIVYI